MNLSERRLRQCWWCLFWFHYFLKKKAGMSFGLGALWVHNWKTVSSISLLVIGLLSSQHCWVESSRICRDCSSWRILSILVVFEYSLDNLKWFTRISSIYLGLSMRFPSPSLMYKILLLARLFLTTIWKNMVFLSPSRTHSLLAFWAQKVLELAFFNKLYSIKLTR